MANPNVPLPPERDAAYAHAAKAVYEATSPLVDKLSDLVIGDAVALTLAAGDIEDSGIVSGLEDYLAAQNLDKDVVEAAEAILTDGPPDDIGERLATGRDEEVRGLTINKRWALQQGQSIREADGNWSDGQWRIDEETGERQFKSLGGAWINEADVDQGYVMWGGDRSAQQAALTYEMRKAMTTEQVEDIAANFRHVAQDEGGWGMNDQQAHGVWSGAEFASNPIDAQITRGTDDNIRALGQQGLRQRGHDEGASGLRPSELEAVENAFDYPFLIRPASWPPVAELPADDTSF